MTEQEIKAVAKEVVKEEAKLVLLCLKAFRGTKVGDKADEITGIIDGYLEEEQK